MKEFSLGFSKLFEKLIDIREYERSQFLNSIDSKRKPTRVELSILESLYTHYIGNHEGLEFSILEKMLNEKKSTLSQAIKRLASSNYICADKTKRRFPLISLQKRGRQVIYGLHNVDRLLGPKLFSDIPKSTRPDLLESVAKVFDIASATIDSKLESVENIHDLKANIARFYDCVIGGQCFFPAEALLVKALLGKATRFGKAAKANRAFVRRAVKFIADNDVRQFIDIGCGLPTFGNTHDLVSPDSKVLYVDNDHYVCEVFDAYLGHHHPNCNIVRGCIEKPTEILTEAKNAKFRLNEPIGVIIGAVFHFCKDLNKACNSLQKLLNRLPNGYFAISHASQNASPEPDLIEVVKKYKQFIAPTYLRNYEEIEKLFNGMRFVPYETGVAPKLVYSHEWRPDIEDEFLIGESSSFQRREDAIALVGVGTNF